MHRMCHVRDLRSHEAGIWGGRTGRVSDKETCWHWKQRGTFGYPRFCSKESYTVKSHYCFMRWLLKEYVSIWRELDGVSSTSESWRRFSLVSLWYCCTLRHTESQIRFALNIEAKCTKSSDDFHCFLCRCSIVPSVLVRRLAKAIFECPDRRRGGTLGTNITP